MFGTQGDPIDCSRHGIVRTLIVFSDLSNRTNDALHWVAFLKERILFADFTFAYGMYLLL